MADNERKVRYSCVRCKKEISGRLDCHLKVCKKRIKGVDYICCALCGFQSAVLSHHIKKHGIDVVAYKERHGDLLSEGAKRSISLRNSIMAKKTNYRNRLKREGRETELLKFNEKVSRAVSLSIMGNDAERKRRSDLLGVLNKREDFRKRASEAAIKTSARKDIQQERAERLRCWRKKNPNDFFNKCTKQMHKFQSRPEKELFVFCKLLNETFKRNQYIKRNAFFTKTKKRQVDILDSKKKIVVEFDGELHFKKKFKSQDLEGQQLKDENFNKSLKEEFCIIRVAYDQFSYRKMDYGFKEMCLKKIKELLMNPQCGLYRLGEAYGKDNIL